MLVNLDEVLKPAKSASKNACIEAMKAKLESEVNGI